MSNKLIDLTALSSYKTQSDLKYQDKLTAGNNISISNNVISTAPYFSGAVLTGKVSVSNDTVYEIDSVILAPGNYFITFTCTFNANATGDRQCGFSINNTDMAGFGLMWEDKRRAVGNNVATQTMVTGAFSISASDYPNGQTFYFLAKQNSGGALNATPRCYYYKF